VRPATQASQLLASVLQRADDVGKLTVLDVGPALPETVAFFADTPCKLHVADLFAELPFSVADDDPAPDNRNRLRALLALPPGSRLDICLFWDLFNYLPAPIISVLLDVLRPHLHPGTRAHAFGVHKRGAPEDARIHGIRSVDTLTLRPRRQPLPGYAPLPQAQLQALLADFRFERSVLLADSRLELLLRLR